MDTDRSIYLAVNELSRRYADFDMYPINGPLAASELRCFSQHGEDGVVAEILHRIGIGERFFVEFGVESGREGNCVFLADVQRWNGLFIEADGEDFGRLTAKYAANPRVTTLNASVTPENVETLFAAEETPIELDVLSIDIDGADYWVWEAITAYRARLVVIEYNSALAPGRRSVQPRDQALAGWDGTDAFGASLGALEDLGARKGYRLVHTELAGANAFLVREDLAEDRFPPPSEVPRWGEPNYFMRGHHHPHNPHSERFPDPLAAPDTYTGPAMSTNTPTAEQAGALTARDDVIWHQRFELVPGCFTPGTNDVGFLMTTAGMPERLAGETVLDIGTTNGGVAFELERRGAGRVVAVDILDADVFGFSAIKELLGSSVEHLQASIYELPAILGEQFDLVVFLGVLYHLRHPLLALDNVRALTRQVAYIESAVCDAELPHVTGSSVARFYRTDELGRDPTNWFSPTVAALADWCGSCGLEPTQVTAWPEPAPSRAMAVCRPSGDIPEYQRISYELPLSASIRRS